MEGWNQVGIIYDRCMQAVSVELSGCSLNEWDNDEVFQCFNLLKIYLLNSG